MRPKTTAFLLARMTVACACLAIVLRSVAATGDSAPSSANTAPTASAVTAPQWLVDYEAALKQAAMEHKPVLLNFTGSDWCIWCHRLDNEVFAKTPFQDYAREHLILVELDFPRRHTLSPELTKQNQTLAEKFNVDGYPTIVVIDADGRELGRTGYMYGGAKTFVREIKHIVLTPHPAPSAPNAQKGAS